MSQERLVIELRTKTDPAWAQLAVDNFEAILIDHAHCEKKAAASAMAMVSRYPEKHELVKRCIKLAQEELRHFQQVHDRILKRGLTLTRDGGDPYAKELRQALRLDGDERLMDLLLVSALIEGRSWERLSILGEHLPDESDRSFYRGLAQAEAGHYRLFVDLAKHYCDGDAVDKRLEELAKVESEIIEKRPVEPRIH